jgi:hypothetical protein
MSLNSQSVHKVHQKSTVVNLGSKSYNISKLMYLQLVSEIKDRTIQEILQTLDRVVVDPSELAPGLYQ